MWKLKPQSDRLSHEASFWQYNGSVRPEFAANTSQGEESVWDFSRPPFMEITNQHVKIVAAGMLVAETHRPLRVCETASPPCYYLKPEDFILGDLLLVEGPQSHCEWKGTAAYWTLKVGDAQFKNFAWSYPEPFEEYAKLKGLLAIYPNRVDRCEINNETVKAQPGNFYGGWITQHLKGPFKGEPGSQRW